MSISIAVLVVEAAIIVIAVIIAVAVVIIVSVIIVVAPSWRPGVIVVGGGTVAIVAPTSPATPTSEPSPPAASRALVPIRVVLTIPTTKGNHQTRKPR